MYLQKLDIHGFKSFADKATLEFNHDLTAIVGPNGSGKSNVADAVRWVLGEQSLKLLRGKKSEDVIFAGSTKRTRLGFAEVNLYLNNEDGRAPIDYREVIITRRIYRSGESEYLVNKNKVRLTDIQLLLAKSNFGQKTYSIIGQGMIDSILTSSPEERKEFFDEATGVRQYQIKKDQAIGKLEHSHENLAQSQQVLLEIEPRLKSLTRQVKKLEKKEEISKALAVLQTQYYGRLYSDLNQEASRLEEKLTKIEEEKNNLEQKIAAGQKTIEQAQIQDTEATAFKKLQDAYSNFSQQKNQLLKELSIIKGKMDLGLTKLGKTDIVWAQNKNDEIALTLNRLTGEIEENRRLMKKLENQLNNKIINQQKILNEYRDLQNQLIVSQESLAKNDQFSLAKIQTHLTALCQKQKEFLDSLDKIKDLNNLPKLKRQAEEIGKEINWLLNKLEHSQAAESSDFLKIQERLNQFLTTKDSLVNEIHELKINLEIAKEKEQHFLNQRQNLTAEKKKIELELTASQLNNQETAEQSLFSRLRELEKSIAEIDQNLEKAQKQLNDFSQSQERNKNALFTLQRSLRDLQIELNALNNETQGIKIALAKIETRKEDLEKEIATEMASDFKPINQHFNINLGETFAEIGRLKNQLAIIGGIDEEVVKEYQEVKTRFDFLNEQVTDMENAINSCRQIIEDLDKKIKKQFEEAFEKINQEFINYFKILFNGGTAKLLLQKKEIKIKEEADAQLKNEESNDADDNEEKAEMPETNEKKNYEIGIEIQATPPGKKVKSLNMLSGGEKALTSIALICAIISNNPSPFVILDEVDAALDEANSERFVKIIDKLSDKTQFICITHNRAAMSQASILYGVTMGADGVSKLLSVNLVEAEKVAEQVV